MSIAENLVRMAKVLYRTSPNCHGIHIQEPPDASMLAAKLEPVVIIVIILGYGAISVIISWLVRIYLREVFNQVVSQ
ncbi:hypothetical protein Ciccas_012266 [Cichlidogyrus casuarinus]|uniref:Uncharacterized protein n=1 Tax=Cichlidogyrus casuarinus TaxID=1844966 RepID=A0ABD2PNW4_9PLAT